MGFSPYRLTNIWRGNTWNVAVLILTAASVRTHTVRRSLQSKKGHVINSVHTFFELLDPLRPRDVYDPWSSGVPTLAAGHRRARMQDNEASNERPRRRYSKPEIRRVDLEPQECLTVGCKTLSISSTGGSSCDSMSCQEIGS